MRNKLLLLAALWLPAGIAHAAQTLNVMTSYPQPVVAVFQQAFEEAHPDVHLNILWRRPHDALKTLKETKGQGVDVLWMPSITTFNALRDQHLLKTMHTDLTGLPQTIGAMQISDTEQRYLAFEIAGYGVFMDTEAIAQAQQTVPHSWTDLTQPVWQGAIALPVPSRIGFAPMLIDQLLQAQGWQHGWQIWQKIAANSKLISQNAPFITERVETGEVKIALLMDFFALTSLQDASRYQFIYPQQTAFNPAHIGILAQTQQTQLAQSFVNFMLSEQGQALLLQPDVRRLPVRAALYQTHHLTVNPFKQTATQAYNYQLGSSRRGYISMIFDAAITDSHALLAKAWQLLNALKHSPAANVQIGLLQQIEQQLTSWPVEEPADNAEIVKACRQGPDSNTECLLAYQRISDGFRQHYQQIVMQLEKLSAGQ